MILPETEMNFERYGNRDLMSFINKQWSYAAYLDHPIKI